MRLINILSISMLALCAQEFSSVGDTNQSGIYEGSLPLMSEKSENNPPLTATRNVEVLSEHGDGSERLEQTNVLSRSITKPDGVSSPLSTSFGNKGGVDQLDVVDKKSENGDTVPINSPRLNSPRLNNVNLAIPHLID